MFNVVFDKNVFFKSFFLFVFLFFVFLFFSSCSSCDNPLKCSIQDRLNKIDVDSSINNTSAELKVLYLGPNTCSCKIKEGKNNEYYSSHGDKHYLEVLNNQCDSGYVPNCFSKYEREKIDGETVRIPYPSCNCVESNNNNDNNNPSCVDNDKSDDTCSYRACGPDFQGNTVKCEFCTNKCGEEYSTDNCVECVSPGSCSCSYSQEEGSWYVKSDSCISGYSASCKSNGDCVCASDEE